MVTRDEDRLQCEPKVNQTICKSVKDIRLKYEIGLNVNEETEKK